MHFHDLSHGKNPDCIPHRSIVPWKTAVVSSFTGPCGGLTQQDLYSNQFPRDQEEVAGVKDWNVPSEEAYGISLSLYEDDKSKQKLETINGIPQLTSTLVGDPVADVFAVVTRENSSVLAVADGVGWGKKPRLAARCAVRAVMEHFTSNMKRLQSKSASSKTVCDMLLESIRVAQKNIIDHKATLTTLSVAVICQISSKSSKSPSEEWGMYVVSVGDSPVYLYCPRSQSVIEATVGCHSHDGIRDVKMAGGTLGPAMGTLPDLANLSLAYLPVNHGDIVFIASDGISDNFSSAICGESTAEPMDTTGNNEELISHPSLGPSAYSTYCNTTDGLSVTLKKHHDDIGRHLSAQTLTACLVNHVVAATEEKRQFMSDCRLRGIEVKRKIREDPEFAERAKKIKGKLDHATVVAYQVGHR